MKAFFGLVFESGFLSRNLGEGILVGGESGDLIGELTI